jgi:hypothetical protein
VDNPFINVVSVFGDGSKVGEITAREGQVTNYGTITCVSGNILLVGSGDSEGSFFIDSTNPRFNIQTESGVLGWDGWPTGTNIYIEQGSLSEFPNGMIFNINHVSGTSYSDGSLNPKTYGRL